MEDGDPTLSMCNWISPIDKCVGTLKDNRPFTDDRENLIQLWFI